jgi:hypothetical protein
MAPAVPPALLVGTLLVIAYAGAFHLWLGRTTGDLVIYLVAAGIGFGAGQALGVLTSIPLMEIGQLHTLEATIGAVVALALVYLLRQPSR